jgi:hypothetical protein
MHNSLHGPQWVLVGVACRESAGQLADALIAKRDDQAVVLLLLLVIYELIHHNGDLIWKLLTLASSTCLQLGWHVLEEPTDSDEESAGSLNSQDCALDNRSKRVMFSTLVGIETSVLMR